MLTVVTSFGPEGWEAYAREFVRTFRQFWPAEVKLLCAWEGQEPEPWLNGFDLLETEPCASFLKRHSKNLAVHGKEAVPTWSAKARAQGYSFRHNAYKFARKVFAVGAAARYVERGKLFWIDADVVTHAHVPTELLHTVMPDGKSLAYLARPGFSHSELGFVGYNLGRLETLAFITAYERAYAEDRFLAESQWDDCFIFDTLVEHLKPEVHQIPHTSREQPFDHSPLHPFMSHLKGNRKFGGPGWQHRSKENAA